jgi:hypothetical protein
MTKYFDEIFHDIGSPAGQENSWATEFRKGKRRTPLDISLEALKEEKHSTTRSISLGALENWLVAIHFGNAHDDLPEIRSGIATR